MPCLLPSESSYTYTSLYEEKKNTNKSSTSTAEFTTAFVCLCASGFRTEMDHLLYIVDIYYNLPLSAIIALQKCVEVRSAAFPFPLKRALLCLC